MPSSCASRATSSHSAVRLCRSRPGRRLVEEQDPRAVHERQREVEPPLHAARVAADAAVGRLGQPDALEQLLRARRARSAFGMPCSVACSSRCSRPVRIASSAASCSAAPIDARTCAPSRTMSIAADARAPARRRQQRRQHQHGRRLAGAVGPEEAVDLARARPRGRCRRPRAVPCGTRARAARPRSPPTRSRTVALHQTLSMSTIDSLRYIAIDGIRSADAAAPLPRRGGLGAAASS